MRSRLLILLIPFTLVFTVAGKIQAQQYTLRQYTAIDGLPQSQVNAMVEDKYGYLWIGTSGGGLAHFDGRMFKVYSTLDGLLSNIITSLFIDSRQNIWVVHPRGLTKFNGLDFKKFQPANSAESLKRVRRVVEFSDTIFMVSNQGLIGKIHNDSVYYWSKQVLPGKSIYFTHISPDRRICYYLSDSSFIVPTASGYRKYPHAPVFSTAYNMFNHGEEVWMDTDSGSFAFDLNSGTFSPRKKVLDRHIVRYDARQDVYWTRDERTLFREKLVGGKIRTDTILRQVPVTQILQDEEGNTWLGTGGNGLYRYYERDFKHIGPDSLKVVKAIEKDRTGALWVGNSGLLRISGGKQKAFALPEGDDDGIHTIRTNLSGDIWVGSYSGLGRFSPATESFSWFTREHGLSSAYITSLDFGGDGRVWIGTTGGGLNYYDGKQFQPYSDQPQGTKNISSLRYVPASKALFIGTEVGLHVLKNDRITSIALPEFEHTSVLSLAIFRDSLVLAGSGGAGVAVIDPHMTPRKLIGPREGLPSGFVFFVASDETDRIWVGTEKGITRLKLDEQLEVVETRDFGYDNGLIGIETSQNAYYISKDEKLFGLIDGLYQFNETGTGGFRSYPVHLTDLEIQYGQIPTRRPGMELDGFFKIPVSPILPSDNNHITVRYNRVDKRYPGSVRYKYFLENFDKTWSQPTPTGHVTYSNLPPGHYIFQVLSTDNAGRWDTVPLKYPFTIKAPFYQTAAFYVVTGSILLGLLVLIILARMRKNVSRLIEVEHIRQQEQESLRKEIARDFHDEMGNQLTRIINYVSLMRLNSNGNGHGQELYHKVEESAKYLYNGTRDFIWAIDPVNDDLSKLFLHVRDFGEKLFEEKGIHFRAYNNVSDKGKLPYGFSREANLIFKEAMTNAFKHSNAINVSYFLRPANGGYEMVLEDDGIGFDAEKIKTSNGIKNIRSRAEKIQSSLLIETMTAGRARPTDGAEGTLEHENRSVGRGTRVLLQFSTTKKKAYDTRNKKARFDR